MMNFKNSLMMGNMYGIAQPKEYFFADGKLGLNQLSKC